MEDAITDSEGAEEEDTSPIITRSPAHLAWSSSSSQTLDVVEVTSSHGAAAAMPDWLRKVLNSNDFVYSTKSKENIKWGAEQQRYLIILTVVLAF